MKNIENLICVYFCILLMIASQQRKHSENLEVNIQIETIRAHACTHTHTHTHTICLSTEVHSNSRGGHRIAYSSGLIAFLHRLFPSLNAVSSVFSCETFTPPPSTCNICTAFPFIHFTIIYWMNEASFQF